MDIRRGDTVLVLSGKDKGKKGTVENINRTKQSVVVGGLNIMKRHMKPSSKYPSGGIVEIAYPIHQSNIKVVEGEAADSGRKTKSTKPTKK